MARGRQEHYIPHAVPGAGQPWEPPSREAPAATEPAAASGPGAQAQQVCAVPEIRSLTNPAEPGASSHSARQQEPVGSAELHTADERSDCQIRSGLLLPSWEWMLFRKAAF